MSIQYNTMLLLLFLVSLTYNVHAQVFDVTKYGARPGGGDASQGVLAAWKAACASPRPAQVLIPKGIFLVKSARFEGPCKSAIGIKLIGTLKAPEDQTQQPKDEWISVYRVTGFHLHGGGYIDGQGKAAWAKKQAKQIGFMLPTSLGINYVTKAQIENIHVVNAKMFQIKVFASKDITLQSVTILAPYWSPNTDGIHIGRSSDVKVLGCTIRTGDDCVSIGDGSRQVTVSKVACGPGHGIAVGSLGLYKEEEPVTGIYVKSCTLTNTENGLRIKTWEDSPIEYVASDIHFDDITLNNVTYPINIDQEYCPRGNCPTQQAPSKIRIRNLSFRGIRGTSSTSQIVKIACSKSHPCEGVEIGDINIKFPGPKGADTSICKNVRPKLTGRQDPPMCTSTPKSK